MVGLASSLARLEPALQRGLRFPGGPTGEEILDADVLIELGPMNPVAAADEPPVRALGDGAVRESGIPGQGNGECPTIHQVDDQRIVREPDLLRYNLSEVSW